MKKTLLFAIVLIASALTSLKAQTIVLQVEMAYQTFGQVSNTTGNFDFENDFVDVAGTFNEWNGEGFQLTRTSDTAFVYADTISDLTVGEVIEFKFRINADWDNSEFPGGGANRKLTVRQDTLTASFIYDNYSPGLVPVYISINMNKKIEDGGFTPAEEFVDVAGTFNGWSGADELWDGNSNGIYEGMVLAPVGEMKWKTRINADWSNAEFPGGSDRVYTVVDTAGGATNHLDVLWYNDDEPASINSGAFAEVQAYPNPFANNISLTNLADVERVSISNIMGQEIKAIDVSNSEILELNTSNLNTGIYFIMLHNTLGDKRAMRVIKE